MGALAGGLFAGTALIGMVCPVHVQPAVAQEQAARQLNFTIAAQPLTSALTQFGQQSGLQISAPAAATRGKTTDGVSGRLPADDALSRLLAGTGLEYRHTSANTVIIVGGTVDVGDLPDDGSILLDTIVVMGSDQQPSGSGFMGTPDWVYEAPSSVSVISREAIQNSATRNARDLLDNVAGVYANRSEAQNPGIAVNIRGLQDQDRIVTMIDGARQSFQRNSHGSSQRTYVDTAFIREVDIEKSSTSGAGSAGSLGGSVNFRTILAEDLIVDDRRWGAELNATTGTNEFNFDGSAAAAVRVSDRFSILSGFSHKNIGAYEIGRNGKVKTSTTYTGDMLLFSGQEVFSSLLKAEADLSDDVKLTLGWVWNDSTYSTGNYDQILNNGDISETEENVVNNTLTSALDWKATSDLIDFKVRFYYNHIDNDKINRSSVATTGTTNYRMGTLGGSLENTSWFFTDVGDLSLNVGAEAFRDDGTTDLNGGEFVINGVDYSGVLTGGTPGGSRDVASGFINAKLEHDDWLTLSGGLRYDWYHISGNTVIFGGGGRPIIGYDVVPPTCFPSPPFPPNTGCTGGSSTPIYGDPVYVPYNVKQDISNGAILPTVTLAAKPFDWLQPFIKYSRSFRPPTVMESYINGGHAGSSIVGYAPNPNLLPERGDTYEIGANISRDGLFKSDDSIRVKAVGFLREITDYITLGNFTYEGNGRQYSSYVNLDGVTRMQGVELEVNYDARTFYIGGSYTYIDTKMSETFTSSSGNKQYLKSGIGPAILFVQPELRVTLDAGVRLFDEKLTLGGRMTHVGESAPELGSLKDNYKIDGYTTYDLYGSYAFTDTTKLRFAVNNLTDLAYAPAMGATYYAAPGRTATASLSFKF